MLRILSSIKVKSRIRIAVEPWGLRVDPWMLRGKPRRLREEPWRLTLELCRVFRSVVADSHSFDEEGLICISCKVGVVILF
jgi:hypothetical protein